MASIQQYPRFYITMTGVLALMLSLAACRHDEEEEEDTTIDEELKQYSRSVDAIPAFNGATCEICIDVSAIGERENLRWAGQYKADPTVADLSNADVEAAILADVNAQIANCPAGSNIKIQFLYHYDAKKLFKKPAAPGGSITRNWDQYESVEAVLAALANNQRLTKVYLAGCLSHRRPTTVNAAFQPPKVTHVVTVDACILLECGTIKGAEYPTFQPAPVRIIVWEKEGDRQIAKVPEDPIDDDEQFNIDTNTVTDR